MSHVMSQVLRGVSVSREYARWVEVMDILDDRAGQEEHHTLLIVHVIVHPSSRSHSSNDPPTRAMDVWAR